MSNTLSVSFLHSLYEIESAVPSITKLEFCSQRLFWDCTDPSFGFFKNAFLTHSMVSDLLHTGFFCKFINHFLFLFCLYSSLASRFPLICSGTIILRPLLHLLQCWFTVSYQKLFFRHNIGIYSLPQKEQNQRTWYYYRSFGNSKYYWNRFVINWKWKYNIHSHWTYKSLI